MMSYGIEHGEFIHEIKGGTAKKSIKIIANNLTKIFKNGCIILMKFNLKDKEWIIIGSNKTLKKKYKMTIKKILFLSLFITIGN